MRLDEGRDDPLVGTLIGGRHRVVDRLAGGGHGTVYRGVQVGIERPVAIKVLAADATDPVAARRFEAEALILGRLRHPHAVSLIDFGHLEDGRPYLVSPLLEGETLAARLERGPLAAATVLDIMGQVARALEDAHEQGVVHRDLKPSNLMLQTIAGRLVVHVIDFGIAQREDDVRLTAEDRAVGTAAYMSPEQIRGERVDARSDLYSLGVVAYQCAAGRLPFDGPTRLAVTLQHLNDPAPPLEGDPRLAELVGWCLAKRPGDRPPDATALIEALDDVASTDVGPVAPAPAPRGGARWLVAGLALGLAVTGALLAMGRTDGPASAGAPDRTGAGAEPVAVEAAAPVRTAPAVAAAAPDRTAFAVEAAAPVRTAPAVEAAAPVRTAPAVAVAEVAADAGSRPSTPRRGERPPRSQRAASDPRSSHSTASTVAADAATSATPPAAGPATSPVSSHAEASAVAPPAAAAEGAPPAAPTPASAAEPAPPPLVEPAPPRGLF